MHRIELKFSYQQVMVWQEYQNLVLIASAVFGKKESEAREPESPAEAQAMIDRLLGKKR